MRLAFSNVDPVEVRMMLGENAAKLYGFDLEALRPAAV
jgi:predicted TIM-barrel fold metal-dependent hydrolase